MGVLRNIDDERFCQLVVAGTDPEEAYKATGGMSKNPAYAAQRRMARKPLRKRIEELMDVGARRAQLSRSKILERIYEDWEKSRQLGQMASALKAAELMGREMHKMFVERKEIGGPGDFDQKSPEELLAFIKGELASMGMDAKQIDAKLGIVLDDNQASTGKGSMVLIPPSKGSGSVN